MKKALKLILLTIILLLVVFFGYNRLEKINERNKYVSEISVLIDYDENKAEDYFNYHKIHPSFEIDRVVAEVNDRNEEILYYDSFFDLIKQPNRFECIVYFFENKEASINDVIVISNKQLLDIEYDAVLMEYLHLDMDGATTRKCVEYSKKYVEAKTEDVIILSNKQLLDMEYDELLLEYLYLDIDGTSIRKCVEYSKKYDEIETEDVVHIVSLGLEEIIPSEQFLSLIYTDFFMPTRVQRYLELYQNNLNYTSRQVVEIVNCDADRQFYTNVEPSDLSKGTLVINNKFNYLESDYVPANLVVVDEKYSSYGARMEKNAYEAFVEMCDAAREDLLEIRINGDNGYRSYDYQNEIYDYCIYLYGANGADFFGARAGYSEHQTGLAVDIVIYPLNGNSTYSYYRMYQWAMENCWDYGFIYRYQGGKEHLTGYMQEDWHYRYVGKEVALFIKEHNITFDEYYTYFVKGY
ncbi:MAG: M15 family metallopeptidase [Erysipelotrichaceae bacterium]|jgi:LAS superfamily LD-carboxypeptidase LdcB